jgi:hypothetical protein
MAMARQAMTSTARDLPACLTTLFGPGGNAPLSTVIFPLQFDDVSHGRRSPDSASWEYLYLPTPGQANACSRCYWLAAMR